jgi:hypothetical protein
MPQSLLAVFLFFVLAGGLSFWYRESHALPAGPARGMSLEVDGFALPLPDAPQTGTVGDLLAAVHLTLGPEDEVFPSPETPLRSGMRMRVEFARTYRLAYDNKEETHATRERTVEGALREAGVALDVDDIVLPGREAVLHDGSDVRVVRVEIREEAVDQDIAFETETREDSKLSWRKKVVTQKGEPGSERLVYRVARHDGKEVSRKLLSRERTKEPVPEIITQGTYVKLGKSHEGAASWYSYTGTLSAANPWLPLGSYVKVTNTSNGKSVIVKINDRGPFGPGRIIDLDKVAFEEIAPLGAGVVNIKMEEILN